EGRNNTMNGIDRFQTASNGQSAAPGFTVRESGPEDLGDRSFDMVMASHLSGERETEGRLHHQGHLEPREEPALEPSYFVNFSSESVPPLEIIDAAKGEVGEGFASAKISDTDENPDFRPPEEKIQTAQLTRSEAVIDGDA